LRADYVGYISGGNLTPNIDKMAKDSIVFTRAFANGPGTNQSFPAILTSTYFLMHGGMKLLPHFTTLAEVLSEHGFKTVAFHSNPFLSKNLGWSRGFVEFYDFMNDVKSPSAFVTKQQNDGFRSMLTRIFSSVSRASKSANFQRFLKKIYYKFSHLEIPYLEGKKLNEYVINWIEQNSNEKFFLWMHYMDPHYPYIPPEEYLTGFTSRKEAFDYNLSANYQTPSKLEVEIFKDLYIGEVKYTDACIGEFLEYLDDKRILDNCLILLLGDHGHAFMEHGRFGHAYDILYNEVVHVPLIIYGLEFSRSISTPVQLLDVPTTLVDVLSIMKPPSFIGKSLFNLIDEENSKNPIFSESAKPDLINLRYDLNRKVVSCVFSNYKFIFNEIIGKVELYDIGKDFEESKNLIDLKEEVYKTLMFLVKEHIDSVSRRKNAKV
jgi:arylsulfatase A-like enzyme